MVWDSPVSCESLPPAPPSGISGRLPAGRSLCLTIGGSVLHIIRGNLRLRRRGRGLRLFTAIRRSLGRHVGRRCLPIACGGAGRRRAHGVSGCTAALGPPSACWARGQSDGISVYGGNFSKRVVCPVRPARYRYCCRLCSSEQTGQREKGEKFHDFLCYAS